jgi:hypothetical protein
MEDLERIVNLDNEFIGQLMESILKERNIPHILRRYHDTAYDGLFENTQGWGSIEAPLKYRDEIVGIYNEIMSQQK